MVYLVTYLDLCAHLAIQLITFPLLIRIDLIIYC